MRRRQEDTCFIKRMWAKATPYIQIGGWAIVAVPAVLSFGKLISDAHAFDQRLTTVEKSVDQLGIVNDKLDLVIKLMRNK